MEHQQRVLPVVEHSYMKVLAIHHVVIHQLQHMKVVDHDLIVAQAVPHAPLHQQTVHHALDPFCITMND